MSKDVNINLGGGKADRLPIKHFQFNMFVSDPAIVMVAKRGSGKSICVRAILDYFKDIPVGLIIAPTDRMNCFYGKWFPDSYIFYTYKSEIIEKVLARQRIIIDKNKKRIKENIEREKQGKKLRKMIDTRSFVVMDDCLGQKGSWVRDPSIQEMLFNGRHYKIMYILTMQFPLGITPELRSNFDYVFLLAEDYISNLKRIYDHYAGMFPSFDSFRQVFSQLTSDYGSMVIVNRGVRKTLFEKIFYYKAPIFDDESGIDTNMGCKQFQKFHKKNYNEEWATKQNLFNADEYLMRKKKNKSLVIVDKIKPEEEERDPKKKYNTNPDLKNFEKKSNYKKKDY